MQGTCAQTRLLSDDSGARLNLGARRVAEKLDQSVKSTRNLLRRVRKMSPVRGLVKMSAMFDLVSKCLGVTKYKFNLLKKINSWC